MVESWLCHNAAPDVPHGASHGFDESRFLQQDLEPMSPTQSAMFASLLNPEEVCESTSHSQGFKPVLHSSPDSQLSHHSSGIRALTQPAYLHYAQDSQLLTQESQYAPPDSWMGDTSASHQVPYDTPDSSFGLQDSDLAMLREAVAAAAQPQAPSQDSACTPQRSGFMPMSQPGRASSGPQSRLDPRLKTQSSPFRTQGLRTIESDAMCWPDFGPYSIQRWQSVLMQYASEFILHLHHTQRGDGCMNRVSKDMPDTLHRITLVLLHTHLAPSSSCTLCCTRPAIWQRQQQQQK